MYWKIYYSDNSTIDDTACSPFDISRRRDIQVIVQESPDHNWTTTCHSDYYIWTDIGDGFRWLGVDHFGLYDYLLRPGEKSVLFGATISNERFREIFELAKSEFGNKEAFTPKERHP
jgi:hypothetical protein